MGSTLSSHVLSVTHFLFTRFRSHSAFQSDNLKEGTPTSQTCLLPPLWVRCPSSQCEVTRAWGQPLAPTPLGRGRVTQLLPFDFPSRPAKPRRRPGFGVCCTRNDPARAISFPLWVSKASTCLSYLSFETQSLSFNKEKKVALLPLNRKTKLIPGVLGHFPAVSLPRGEVGGGGNASEFPFLS